MSSPITAKVSPKSSTPKTITTSHIILDSTATTKKEALANLANAASHALNLIPEKIFAALYEREKLGSTYIANGGALPNARLAGLTQTYVFALRLQQAVDFAPVTFGAPYAPQQTDIIFAVLSPLENGSDHLRVLTRTAGWLRNPGMMANLRLADDAAEFLALLNSEAEFASTSPAAPLGSKLPLKLRLVH